jgi:hypothetical protein
MHITGLKSASEPESICRSDTRSCTFWTSEKTK